MYQQAPIQKTINCSLYLDPTVALKTLWKFRENLRKSRKTNYSWEQLIGSEKLGQNRGLTTSSESWRNWRKTGRKPRIAFKKTRKLEKTEGKLNENQKKLHGETLASLYLAYMDPYQFCRTHRNKQRDIENPLGKVPWVKRQQELEFV